MLKVYKAKNPFTPINFIVGLYHYYFTTYGKALMFILFFSIMFYSIDPYRTYYHIIVSFLGILFTISFVSMYLLPYNIRVERTLPSRVQAGKPFNINIKVTNNSFLPVLALSAEQIWKPPNFKQLTESNLVISIGKKKYDEISFKNIIEKRGAYELPASIVFSNFPFFILRKGKFLRDKETILAYPSYNRLDNFALPVHRKYQPGGVSLASSIGDSTEYIDNRDYQPGDPLKKIDWKAFSRLQKPIVKVYQEEYFVRVALILDTYIPGRITKKCRNEFEKSVSITASIADFLSRKEYIIDIFVLGSTIYQLTTGRNIGFLNNILDLLACVDCDSKEYIHTLYSEISPKLKQISSVILVLQDYDEKRERLINILRSLGLSIKIILITDKTKIPFNIKETDNLTVRFVSEQNFKDGLTEL
ncbi:MAG: DUF58 domain-containing protein [bacterium]|nr:DUF58 domain-containing protein [bacterium]